MIVPMKKVSILVLDKEKEAALQEIRELGTLHLKTKTATSPALTKLMDRNNQIDIALHVLASFPHKKSKKLDQFIYDGDVVDHVLELYDRRKTLQDYLFYQQREKENLKKWGDFDPKSLEYLSENGVKIYLYEISPISYAENVGDIPVITLSKDKKSKFIKLLAFDEIPNETPLPVPKRCIVEVKKRNAIRKEELAKIDAELINLWRYKEQLDAEKKAVMADIEFETVRAGMDLVDEEIINSEQGADYKPLETPISWISGYVPTPEMEPLKKAAAKNGWALCYDDPALDDLEVPTKLKNNCLVRLIYPLTTFLELSPGYRETDISSLFLIFFTLFCGMLVGDAGYGAIAALCAIIGIVKTAKKGVPVFFKFLLLLSMAIFTWGVLTCSWFGVDIAHVPQILQNISLPLVANFSADPLWLATYNANNFWIASGLIEPYVNSKTISDVISANLMLFCFTIALVHLGIARIMRIIRNMGSLRVLAEIGSFTILIGMYFVVLSLVVEKSGFDGVKAWQAYSIAGGFSLVFIFVNYEGSILKGIIASFANIITVALSLINVFSDVISYIRLWAVGVAGALLAATINSFAGPLFNSWAFIALAIGLLLFGHMLNLVLNVLAVLVHGVRLNTLEFSNNLGLNWSGLAYKPFIKR